MRYVCRFGGWSEAFTVEWRGTVGIRTELQSKVRESLSAFFYLQLWAKITHFSIIRKTKRFAIPERAVYFLKTKRTAGVLPHPKNFRPAYAGIHIMQERSPDTIRTPFFSFCRFAPAFRASRYAASLNALYATTLCALTSLPRKARREPTDAFALEATIFAFVFDTPPLALA